MATAGDKYTAGYDDGQLVLAVDDDGNKTPFTLDADGALITSSAGGGGDASAANQALEIAELEAINAAIDTSGDDPVMRVAGDVAVSGSVTVTDGGGVLTVDGTVSVGSIAAGDNNIGNFDVASMPATDPQVNYILYGDTVLPVQHLNVDTSADGELIAAQGAGVIIALIGVYLQVSAATLTKFVIKANGSGGTSLITSYPGDAGGGINLPNSAIGHGESGANQNIYLDITGTGSVGGVIRWVEYTP